MTSTIQYDGNLRTRCTHIRSGSVIETDAPVDNNGKGERFSPTDLVATALGTCMITIMDMKAQAMEIDLSGLTIDCEKVMGSDPRRITGINLTFHFPEALHTSEKQRTILENAALSCPVIKSIHPDINVKTDFNWS